MVQQTTAEALEKAGNSGSIASGVTGLLLYVTQAVDWLNSNYMAILAVCAIVTCIVGAYGTLVRVRMAREKHERDKR